MTTLPFATLPPTPQRCDASTVLARLVDAIGFRYHHVSDGLRDADWNFRAHPEAMTLRAVSVHLLQLIRRSASHFQCRVGERVPTTNRALRQAILQDCWTLRQRIHRISPDAVMDERWPLIHGPLADALTHIGQIATWRRQAGNPMPAMNWFQGKRR